MWGVSHSCYKKSLWTFFLVEISQSLFHSSPVIQTMPSEKEKVRQKACGRPVETTIRFRFSNGTDGWNKPENRARGHEGKHIATPVRARALTASGESVCKDKSHRINRRANCVWGTGFGQNLRHRKVGKISFPKTGVLNQAFVKSRALKFCTQYTVFPKHGYPNYIKQAQFTYLNTQDKSLKVSFFTLKCQK